MYFLQWIQFSGRRLWLANHNQVLDSHVIICFLYSMSDAYYKKYIGQYGHWYIMTYLYVWWNIISNWTCTFIAFYLHKLSFPFSLILLFWIICTSYSSKPSVQMFGIGKVLKEYTQQNCINLIKNTVNKTAKLPQSSVSHDPSEIF